MKNRRKFIITLSAISAALWGKKFLPLLPMAKSQGGNMLTIRRSQERGFADHGWLKSLHTFSFADYYDPNHMGFKTLRVINEDRIEGGTGFGAHPHRDMEIISYVAEGALEHKDSMGTVSIIRPGEVQRMSAGTGVVHSEFNAQLDKVTHFFQIWIMPNQRGGNPGYGQKSFEKDLNSRDKVLVVSKDAREGSIGIKQDVDMYISRLPSGKAINFNVREERGVWIQVTRGQLQIDNQTVSTGDAVSTLSAGTLNISAVENSEIIIFDIA